MYKGKKIGVVIVAAGAGTRLGGPVPKQYLHVRGAPMVFHSVRTFASCEEVDCSVLVTGADAMEFCRDGLKEIENLQVVSGGKERADSVWAGLQALPKTVDHVLVHDGARPFLTRDLAERMIRATVETGAAVPAVRPKDTIREEGRTLDREKLYCVQTPQGFRCDILREAYEEAFRNGFQGTDEASYVEQLGVAVTLVEGEEANIKITTKEDLPLEPTEAAYRERLSAETPVTVQAVGMGYDVHRLAGGRPLILGGVHIPWEKGLVGHSDADVLLHAIMDAMLGAAGLGDIGEHFPDTSPAYEGASSVKLLEEVHGRICKEGFHIGNIDATVIAQAPKVGPYKGKMRTIIARTLDMDERSINLKATTTERLGFVGRTEGIAAQAVCILEKPAP